MLLASWALGPMQFKVWSWRVGTSTKLDKQTQILRGQCNSSVRASKKNTKVRTHKLVPASSWTGLKPMQFNFLSEETAAPDNKTSLQTSNALEPTRFNLPGHQARRVLKPRATSTHQFYVSLERGPLWPRGQYKSSSLSSKRPMCLWPLTAPVLPVIAN